MYNLHVSLNKATGEKLRYYGKKISILFMPKMSGLYFLNDGLTTEVSYFAVKNIY